MADQVRLRPHDGVAADDGVGADPGLRGVDEGNALGHPVLVDAVARDGGELRELDAAVDAQAVAVVVTVEDGDRLAVTLEDFEHVGQVVLGLCVVVADLVDVGGKLRAVEGVAAGVALQQRGGLLGRAVLLLDDALDLTIGAQLDAAVAKGSGGVMVMTVQASSPVATVCANLATVSAVMSGRSPLSTTTGPCVMPQASSATLTAWPVPRRSVCSTHSTLVALLA